MTEINHVAVLGAGVIGASWSALFLAAGKSVAVYDPMPGAEASIRDFVETAWPTLQELGFADNGDPTAFTVHSDAASAVDGALFIQENAPERAPIKHALYAEIEPHLATGAILSSSTSGLTLSALQEGWKDPSRIILGHPFNPPHLIPLVECTGNDKTADWVVPAARAFYESVGKVTIELKKEAAGHVANRLQAAIWREAIHLVVSGVASVEDVDKTIWAGPGLRWAAMGPTMLFNLGAGPGGMAEFCARYGDSFHRWWDDLGNPRLDAETVAALVEGVDTEAGGASPAALSAQRDALIRAMLAATGPLRRAGDEVQA